MSYDEYLDSLQAEAGKFRPIKWYATRLIAKFNDIEDYETSKKIVSDWYKRKGRDKNISFKPIKSEIYVELRMIPNKDTKEFNCVMYLVKPFGTELDEIDKNATMDIIDEYGIVTSPPLEKISDTATKKYDKSVWKTTFKFKPEMYEKNAIIRFKHLVVDFVRAKYGDKFDVSSRMPSWIYSFNESLTNFEESLKTLSKLLNENFSDDILNDVELSNNPENYLSDEFVIPPVEVDIPEVTEHPAPKFRVFWKAWKDGNDAQGETESNLETAQMAKAEAMTKLLDLGFTNIEILAIENTESQS